MIKLSRNFFFRTTWFPEIRGKSVKPWALKGNLITSTFPTGLHPAQVLGTGKLRKGEDGQILIDQKLKVIEESFFPGRKKRLIKNPFLSVAGNKAILWANLGSWQKFGFNAPSGLLPALAHPSRILARDQKRLLKLQMLWELRAPGKRKTTSHMISVAGNKRKENLHLFKPARKSTTVKVIAPAPVRKKMSEGTFRDLARAVSALECIFSSSSKEADHRQTLSRFRDQYRKRFGEGAVKLSEIFDPAEGLTFPYVRRGTPEFSPGLEKKLLSFLDRNSDELSLSAKDLDSLQKSAVEVPQTERIQFGYLRFSSVSVDDSWKAVIHDVANSRIIRPFYPAAHLTPESKRLFRMHLDENCYQLLQNFPERFGDSVKGERLGQGILVDYREVRRGDIWWKDLWCSLENHQFVLRKTKHGKPVVPVIASQVAREFIELDLYRFLAAVVEAGAPSSIGWLWPSGTHHRRFPRISFGDIILSPRFWLLTVEEIDSLMSNKTLRERKRIDEQVFLCHGSEKFLLSFNRESSWKALRRRILSPRFKRVNLLRVEESFSGGELGVRSVEGASFREEIFLPFSRPLR